MSRTSPGAPASRYNCSHAAGGSQDARGVPSTRADQRSMNARRPSRTETVSDRAAPIQGTSRSGRPDMRRRCGVPADARKDDAIRTSARLRNSTRRSSRSGNPESPGRGALPSETARTSLADRVEALGGRNGFVEESAA